MAFSIGLRDIVSSIGSFGDREIVLKIAKCVFLTLFEMIFLRNELVLRVGKSLGMIHN